MRYFTTYENSRTKRAQKKSCFLLILRISKSSRAAMCCLNADLYLSFHKHTPKLPLALSRLSRSLLDRFLNDKTWFFVFSTLYARWVTKGLRNLWTANQSREKSFDITYMFKVFKRCAWITQAQRTSNYVHTMRRKIFFQFGAPHPKKGPFWGGNGANGESGPET